MESDLAQLYGLPRDEVRAKRRLLTEGVHWARKSGAICYTDAGVQALAGLLIPGQEPETAAEEPAGPVEVIVRKLPANPKLLLAQKKEGGELVRVRVNRRENFRPGMVVPVEPDPAVAGLFFFRGRLPRRPGKW